MEYKYVILDATDVPSSYFVRKRLGVRFSVDGSKFIYKYAGDQPLWIFKEKSKDLIGIPEYNRDEIEKILMQSEWNPQIKGLTI